MLKLLKYLSRKEWIFVALSVLFVAGQVYLDLRVPTYMAEITRLVKTPGSEISDILAQGGWMLLAAVGSMVLSIIVGFFAARVATTLAKEVRGRVFNKTLAFSMEEINTFSTSSLITRSTNDINQVQLTVAMGLQVMIKAPILAVWAIAKILGSSWQWTAATGVGVAILLITITLIVTLAISKFKIVQTLVDNLNRVTREHLTGIRVVHAYNAEPFQNAKFEKANDELTSTNLFVNRTMAIMQPTMSFIMGGLGLSIYWIGAHLINAAQMTDKIDLFANMVVFSSYAVQVIMAFMFLAMTFIMLPRAEVSAVRINEVLDKPLSIMSGAKKEATTGLKGKLEVKNVSFKYPDAEEYVLHDISFTAQKGETVAFIGSTGSGKSTLINLIPRFYDVSAGEILIDGMNVKEYELDALHQKFGYASQKAILFSGTVKSNVNFGDTGREMMTDEEVRKAIEIAQGKDFVEKMEGEYDAAIAQGGTNVSGGQKQRLSIARAVSREPEFFIFDDTFSALDYKTDRMLRKAIKEETENITTFIVAQRIGTIRDADKILVLDEGKVVGEGTHNELMKTCQTYQEIAYSQLSKEELENE